MRRRSLSTFKQMMYERYRLNEEDEEKKDDEGDAADDLFGGGDDKSDEGGDDAEKDSGGEEDDAGAEDAAGDDTGEDKKDAGGKDDPASDLSDDEKEEVARDWAASKAMETGGTSDDGEAPDPDVLTSEIEKHLERALRAAEDSAKMDLARRVSFLSGQNEPGTFSEGWWRRGLSKLLFEAESKKDPVFDVSEYAQHVSRFIFNYDKMIDVPFIIYTKAYDYIKSLYGDAIAEQFKDTMEEQYDISFDEEEAPPQVYAVGARPSGGGA